MKRPGGITVLCLLLGWLTIGGIANGIAILSGSFPMPRGLGLLALAYVLTAGAAVVNLWRMRPYGLIALRAWMAVCLIFFVMFALVVRDFMLGGYVGGLAFLLVVLWLFRALDGYVCRRLDG